MSVCSSFKSARTILQTSNNDIFEGSGVGIEEGFTTSVVHHPHALLYESTSSSITSLEEDDEDLVSTFPMDDDNDDDDDDYAEDNKHVVGSYPDVRLLREWTYHSEEEGQQQPISLPNAMTTTTVATTTKERAPRPGGDEVIDNNNNNNKNNTQPQGQNHNATCSDGELTTTIVNYCSDDDYDDDEGRIFPLNNTSTTTSCPYGFGSVPSSCSSSSCSSSSSSSEDDSDTTEFFLVDGEIIAIDTSTMARPIRRDPVSSYGKRLFMHVYHNQHPYHLPAGMDSNNDNDVDETRKKMNDRAKAGDYDDNNQEYTRKRKAKLGLRKLAGFVQKLTSGMCGRDSSTTTTTTNHHAHDYSRVALAN